MGRLRTTVKLERGSRFHVDTLDLYSSRSRTEFVRRVSKAFDVEEASIEEDLLKLLIEAEKTSEDKPTDAEAALVISDSERQEALLFLRQKALLDQVAEDIDALGYVGEKTNKRLLYLVAILRKLADPLSSIILSQSGAGKSGLTEVIEKLTPVSRSRTSGKSSPVPTPEAEQLLLDHLDELELHRFSRSNRKLVERVVGLLFHHLSEKGIEDFREVDEEHLVSFMMILKSQPIAPGTRSTYLSAVKRFFTFLDRRSVILHNPAEHIRLPRVQRLPRFVPTQKQVARLLQMPPTGSALGLRDRALLETFYGSVRLLDALDPLFRNLLHISPPHGWRQTPGPSIA